MVMSTGKLPEERASDFSESQYGAKEENSMDVNKALRS